MEKSQLISLQSEAGRTLFDQSIGQSTFLRLFPHFVTQDNLTFCGPATASMILNASGIQRPISSAHAPHELFVQEWLFSEEAGGRTPRDEVARAGIDLERFSHWFRHRDLVVKVRHAFESSADALRSDFRESFADGSEKFIATNFYRPELGQVGGGHLSPIGLYHELSDRALVLDVARYKYQPYWVEVGLLFQSMIPLDESTNRSRGWVIVEHRRAPD